MAFSHTPYLYGAGPSDWPFPREMRFALPVCRNGQVAMNGTRLSLFAPIQGALGVDPDTNSKTSFFFRNLAAGAACGAAGAVVGSPLYLIKARLQSQSTAHNLRTPGAGEFR